MAKKGCASGHRYTTGKSAGKCKYSSKYVRKGRKTGCKSGERYTTGKSAGKCKPAYSRVKIFGS